MEKIQRQHLAEIEAAAEDVLSHRQLIVNLDKQRQKTREAIKAVESNKAVKKTWMWNGSLFLKIPTETAEKSLRRDFRHYEEEINRLRKELKPKVNKLNDLEHKDGLKGFDLVPLHEKELSKVMANLD